MRARLHNLAKKTACFTQFGKAGPNDAAGVGACLIISPHGSTQLFERLKTAILSHYEIGKIDHPPLIPRACWNGNSEQFYVAPAQVGFMNVRESAEPKNLNLAFVEKPLPFLPKNVVNVAGFDSQPGLNISGDVLAKRLAVFRHA